MKKLIASLILAASLVGISALPAEAHTKPYDSTPGAEHNLCVWFRPFQAGEIYNHVRDTGTERVCFVAYFFEEGTYRCYQYYIRWYGGWNGPYEFEPRACPSPI